MVMASFNAVNGIPATGNRKLLRGILREEWDFDGVVISDWGSVGELIPHGVAKDEAEAAYLAIQAGVDIEMMTATYVKHLSWLVVTGVVDIKWIDEAVLRILSLKAKLGLFENPYRGANEELEKKIHMSPYHRDISRELATKSIVLLQNHHRILPLQKEMENRCYWPVCEKQRYFGALVLVWFKGRGRYTICRTNRKSGSPSSLCRRLWN